MDFWVTSLDPPPLRLLKTKNIENRPPQTWVFSSQKWYYFNFLPTSSRNRATFKYFIKNGYKTTLLKYFYKLVFKPFFMKYLKVALFLLDVGKKLK